MGIGRPFDPYSTTKPQAWVDADEDVLRTYISAFQSVSMKVSAQLEIAKGERLELFHGASLDFASS